MHYCFPLRSALAAHITLPLRNEVLFLAPREDRVADAASASSSEAVIFVAFSTLFSVHDVSVQRQDQTDLHRLIDIKAPKCDMGADAGKQGPAPGRHLFEDERLVTNRPIQSIVERHDIAGGRQAPSSR
jgi:hypothetical protein